RAPKLLMLLAECFGSHVIFNARDLSRRSKQMATRSDEFAKALAVHARDFGIDLDDERVRRLVDYYELVMKWNPRLHLVAACSPREFAVRHVLESLVLLKHLPLGAAVTDVGSGGGLPIVPCLLARDDLSAT